MENLSLTSSALAPYIQHTKIQADATRHEMERHINEAVEHGFNAAMVSGSWVWVVIPMNRAFPASFALEKTRINGS